MGAIGDGGQAVMTQCTLKPSRWLGPLDRCWTRRKSRLATGRSPRSPTVHREISHENGKAKGGYHASHNFVRCVEKPRLSGPCPRLFKPGTRKLPVKVSASSRELQEAGDGDVRRRDNGSRIKQLSSGNDPSVAIRWLCEEVCYAGDTAPPATLHVHAQQV